MARRAPPIERGAGSADDPSQTQSPVAKGTDTLLRPGCNRCQTVGSMGAFSIGLVVTAFGFGFRHGIDWDHIAALTDITSSQTDRRRSMWFATLYALGHGLVVFGLGFGAIVLAQRLPSGVDTFMERFVGATLIILAVYVLYALVRHRRDFRM